MMLNRLRTPALWCCEAEPIEQRGTSQAETQEQEQDQNRQRQDSLPVLTHSPDEINHWTCFARKTEPILQHLTSQAEVQNQRDQEHEQNSDSVPVLTHRALSIAQRIAGYAGDELGELQSLRTTSQIDEALPDVSEHSEPLRLEPGIVRNPMSK